MNPLDLSSLLLGASVPVAFLMAASFPDLRRVAHAAGWGLFVSLPLSLAALAGLVDGVVAAMGGLVNLVGLVVARFSMSYLDGDPNRGRYARYLAGTLAAVTTLVVSEHLLLTAVSWTLTSLCLHPLLTHFDRTVARRAARKKFLVSRLADAAFLTALGLLYVDLGTLSLGAVNAAAQGAGGLSPAQHAAALLIVGCVALKSAQLPFHGWLSQVMEAPTPVSALLHAGVVNIGGFVLVRLAPFMSEAVPAQTLLVGIGTTTAVLAALVMTTQTTVKGMLAWSTMAQMGFMLMQCGLGAWPLAVLHLLAHSLYKAHAFLTSGSTVERARAYGLASPKPKGALGVWLGAAAVSLVGVAVVATLFGADPTHEPALWAMAAVLSLALTPLLVQGAGQRALLPAAITSLTVAALYFSWHGVFASMIPPGPADGVRVAIVLVGFGGAFLAQALLQVAPDAPLSRALYPRLAAGLYLDDLFTRFTLGR